MVSTGARVGCACLAIPLLLLSLVLFAVVIGLGGWGIVKAQEENPCSNKENITSGCSPQLVIVGSVNNTQDPALISFNPLEYTYWLAGATGVGVVWAFCWTIAAAVVIAVIHWFNEADKDEKKKKAASKDKAGKKDDQKEQIPLQRIGSGTPLTDEPDEPDSGITESTIITVGANHEKQEWVDKPLRTLSVGTGIGLFFSSLFFIFAILCLLWGIGVAFDHTRRDDDVTVITFVGVELLTAVILPLCLFAAGVLLAAVLDFVTVGHADLRTHIPAFLPVVKFESGKDSKGVPHDYWVIEDTFYFELAKRHDRSDHGFLYSFDKSPATWFLSAIVCIGVHLAISYFVDFTLDTQTTLFDPTMCDTIDSTFQCFYAGNLTHVNCGDTNSTIHCFKFYRFGVDVDLISAISQAFAFYLVASAVFARIFSVLKIILHIKPSKWWGLGFIIVAVLGFIGGLILFVLWIYGYAESKVEEILHFNIINIAQYFMVCGYVLMVGLLLMTAKWWERIDINQHARPIKKQLVHYEDAERGEIEHLAHATHASRDDVLPSADTKDINT